MECICIPKTECNGRIVAAYRIRGLLTPLWHSLQMRWILVILMLAACDMAGRDFRGLPVTRVDLGGMQFAVRTNGTKAEAIRLNRMLRPRMDLVGPLAGLAIEQVSGCRVRQISGDVAVVTARLQCAKGAAPTRGSSAYKCMLQGLDALDGFAAEALTCHPDPG